MSVASANPAQTLRHPSGHFWTLEFGENGFIVSVTWSDLRSVKSNITTFISTRHPMSSSSSLPALPILPGYEVTEGPEQRTGCAHLNLTPYCVFLFPSNTTEESGDYRPKKRLLICLKTQRDPLSFGFICLVSTNTLHV